jgi:uncharacterized protein involved in type VI secretion and phage assembly
LSNDRDMEQLLVETVEHQRSRYFGKYRGLVREVDESLGRVKATVPELFGEEDSPWATPSVPFAGANHGLVLLPEVDDGVWIEFEAGDLSRPIWSGFWWADGEMPDPGSQQARVLVTTGGHKLVLDDENNKVQLLHSGGAELTLGDSEISLKIGSAKIVLSSSGVSINNGALEVTT